VVELRAGRARASVDTEGGRLTRLRVGRTDLLAEEGSFVMAPWAGRTGGGRFTYEGVEHPLPVHRHHAPHAIHGTVRDRPWTVTSATEVRVELATDLGPDWPWPGRCEQLIELAEDAIALHLAVHAEADPFPAIVGWHPWFRKPASVALAAAAMLERGEDHLPTGARVEPVAPGDRPLDDAFEQVDWPVVLDGSRRGATVTVDAEHCPYVVVYDEQAHATCVEPQTGPPNGLATGEWSVVAPGTPLLASTTWRWRT
jgi:aldose 1-epimerase